jgi:hypothetical protein
MNTLPNQPHVEFWNTERYSPKYMFKDFPPDGKFAFAMATMFFSPRLRGEVTLASTDPLTNLKVQHNFLADPLDMLVFSEGCRLANEIALEGAGTKDIIVGSWPALHGHDKFTEREQWQEAIRQRADTCESEFCQLCGALADNLKVITQLVLARWGNLMTRWQLSMRIFVSKGLKACASLTRASCQR